MLSADDEAALDRVVSRLEGAPDLEAFGRAVAEGLLSLIPGISATYTEVNAPAQRAFAVIVPEPEPSWWTAAQAVFEAHAHEHPILRHAEATGETRAITWDEVTDVDVFRRTELFRRFYAPLGIDSQLIALLPGPEGVRVGIGVNRGPEGFDDRDRTLLDVLRARAASAYRAVQLADAHGALQTALAGDGWAVVLADGTGRVVSTSFDDASLVAPGDLLPEPLLGSFLAVTNPHDRLARQPGRAGPASLRWSRPGSQPLTALVVPNTVPPHVVLVRPGRSLAEASRAAFGLTDRQSDVAAALVAGHDNAAIARELGIAPATVKKHLEAVYRALGVSSRGAAVARLVSATDS